MPIRDLFRKDLVPVGKLGELAFFVSFEWPKELKQLPVQPVLDPNPGPVLAGSGSFLPLELSSGDPSEETRLGVTLPASMPGPSYDALAVPQMMEKNPQGVLYADVMALRAEMEAVSTVSELVSFLGRGGPLVHHSLIKQRHPWSAVSFAEFRRWQLFFLKSKLRIENAACPSPVIRWEMERVARSQWSLLRQGTAGTFWNAHLQPGEAAAVMRVSSVLEAMAALLQMEILSDTVWKECLYCGKRFVRGGKEVRSFCSMKCQQGETQRRRSKKLREEKGIIKGRKPRGPRVTLLKDQ